MLCSTRMIRITEINSMMSHLMCVLQCNVPWYTFLKHRAPHMTSITDIFGEHKGACCIALEKY